MGLNKELDGFLVVALEQAVAAPYCSLLLADAGARVIKIERAGGEWSAQDAAAFKQPTIDMFTQQSHPLYASARLWDDGIIDPRKSREVLALSLAAACNAPIEETRFGVFRM